MTARRYHADITAELGPHAWKLTSPNGIEGYASQADRDRWSLYSDEWALKNDRPREDAPTLSKLMISISAHNANLARLQEQWKSR
ncbi:MAG: hypothetical protein ACR2QF_00450 [Geminicoccaceae bacterium]